MSPPGCDGRYATVSSTWAGRGQLGARHNGAFTLATVRLALLSDTHLPSIVRDLDALGPECGDFLRGADLILHGGDVTHHSVLDWLEQYAPVVAAEGNNDDFVDKRIKLQQYLEVEGWLIGMVHNLAPETRPLHEIAEHRFGQPVQIMIGGHTHYERIRHESGYVLINSGSPILPHHKETRLGTMGLLELSRDTLRAEIAVLGQSIGKPNPARSHSLQLTREEVDAARVGAAR